MYWFPPLGVSFRIGSQGILRCTWQKFMGNKIDILSHNHIHYAPSWYVAHTISVQENKTKRLISELKLLSEYLKRSEHADYYTTFCRSLRVICCGILIALSIENDSLYLIRIIIIIWSSDWSSPSDDCCGRIDHEAPLKRPRLCFSYERASDDKYDQCLGQKGTVFRNWLGTGSSINGAQEDRV